MGVKYLKPNEDFSFPADFGFTESAKGRHDARNQKFADDDEYGDGSYVERQAKARGGRIKRADGGSAGGYERTEERVPSDQKMQKFADQQQAVASRQATYVDRNGNTIIGPNEAVTPVPISVDQFNSDDDRGYRSGGRIHRAAGGAISAPGQAPAAGAAVGAPPPAGANPMGALAHATVTMPAIDMLQGATRMMQTGRQQGARAALTAVAASAAHNRGMPMGADAAPQMAAPEAQAPMQAGPAVAAAKGGFIKKAINHPGRETGRAEESGRSVHQQMEHDAHSKNPSLRGAANLGLRLTGGDLSPRKRKG